MTYDADYSPHPDDVTLVADLLVEWFGHDEPTLRADATDFLAEIGPRIEARALRQAADAVVEDTKAFPHIRDMHPFSEWLLARADGLVSS